MNTKMQLVFLVLFFSVTINANSVPTNTHDFSYENQNDWLSMGSCGGSRQSPINFPCMQQVMKCPAKKSYSIFWSKPVVEYKVSDTEDIRRQFDMNNSWAMFSNETNDYTFKALQFHWHRPSQHNINGKAFDLELHLVHVLDSPTIRQYAVVGILFEVDESLQYDVFDSMELYQPNFTDTMPFPIPVTNAPAYHYKGSLTSPPCLQAVNFFIQEKPYKITRKNLDKFAENIIEGRPNNRLLQRLGDRQVYLIGNQCGTGQSSAVHM